MANYKNTAYASTSKTSSPKDAASHLQYKKQLQAQDKLISDWLNANPKKKKAYK